MEKQTIWFQNLYKLLTDANEIVTVYSNPPDK